MIRNEDFVRFTPDEIDRRRVLVFNANPLDHYGAGATFHAGHNTSIHENGKAAGAVALSLPAVDGGAARAYLVMGGKVESRIALGEKDATYYLLADAEVVASYPEGLRCQMT